MSLVEKNDFTQAVGEMPLNPSQTAEVLHRLHEARVGLFAGELEADEYSSINKGTLEAHATCRSIDETLHPDDYVYKQFNGITTLMSAPDDMTVMRRMRELGVTTEQIEELVQVVLENLYSQDQKLNRQAFTRGFVEYFDAVSKLQA